MGTEDVTISNNLGPLSIGTTRNSDTYDEHEINYYNPLPSNSLNSDRVRLGEVTEYDVPTKSKHVACPSPEDDEADKFNKLAISMIVLVVSFTLSAHACFETIISQFLYNVYAKAILGNVSGDTTRHPCGQNSTNNTDWDQKVQHVQDSTSNFILYLNIVSYGLGMISNLFMGTYSHLLKRRTQLLFPTLGYTIRCSVLLIVIYWELDVKWLYLGFAMDGLGGTISGLFFGVFLYTSDITSRNKKRTLGVAIIEGVKGLLSGGMKLLTGFLIDHNDFIAPALVTMGLQFAVILIVVCLPNHKPEMTELKKKKISFLNALKIMMSPFMVNDKRVRLITGLSMVTFTAYMTVAIGLSQITTLYTMDFPFCWSAITIGWFNFWRDASHNLFTVFGVHFLYIFLPGVSLAILGLVFSISAYLLFALAQTSLELYMVPLLSFGQGMCTTLIRGEVSKLHEPELQGPMFACFAVLESVGFFLGPLIFLNVYKTSLHVYRGLEFFIGCGILLIPLSTLIMHQITYKKYLKTGYKSMKDQDTDH